MVEGLLDAAAAQAHWLVEVVAYVAGAPALSQLRTIARHGIVAATICPDPDSGGEAGILSFLRNLDPKIRGYVAPELPDGHDSDEFSLSRGVGARREQIGRVERGPIYRARSILKKHDHELATDRGRDAALDELTCYAAEVQARDLDDIVEVAAVPLGMQAETLRSVLGALGDRRNGHVETGAGDRRRCYGHRAPRDLRLSTPAPRRDGRCPGRPGGRERPRVLYQQHGQIVRVRLDEQRRPVTEAMTAKNAGPLRGRM